MGDMCFCDDGIFPDFLVTESSSASEEGEKKSQLAWQGQQPQMCVACSGPGLWGQEGRSWGREAVCIFPVELGRDARETGL